MCSRQQYLVKLDNRSWLSLIKEVNLDKKKVAIH